MSNDEKSPAQANEQEETQRLMLHLSIEPLQPARPRPAEMRVTAPARASLLRRLLRRAPRGAGA